MAELLKIKSSWVCMVRRTGYHNGVPCNSLDPHSGWECGWYWDWLCKAPGPDSVVSMLAREVSVA